MSVWNSIVGQAQVVEQLKAVASGDPKAIAQSWLICGPPGSGRSNVARAFAAALESPDHGLNDEPTKTTEQVLAGTHPDVSVLATNKVTIGIDEVRDIITTSEQMPGTAPWRIIIIEDVDRMMERTTNVLLKEIEEPSPHTIWLLCAPSAQDVLPTIRSRTRIVNLAVPSNQAVAKFLESQGFEPNIAARAARLSEGHIGIASLYAKDERVMTDRDELIVGVLGLHRASDAVLLAGNLIDNAKAQAEAEVNVKASEAEADFRRINGLGPKDRIPPETAWRIQCDRQKKTSSNDAPPDSRVTCSTVRSIRSPVSTVTWRCCRTTPRTRWGSSTSKTVPPSRNCRYGSTVRGAVRRLEDIATARRRLNGNGNPVLVFEALFCALIP